MICKLLLSTLLVLAAPAFSQHVRSSSESILEIANGNDSFETLSLAIDLAGLNDFFGCKAWYCTEFTVFAPTNGAFGNLPDEVLEQLTSPPYKKHLKNTLLYHTTVGRRPARSISAGDKIDTLLSGEQLSVSSSGDGLTLNDNSLISATDVEASNGIVHVIDNVLVPPFMQKNIIDIASEDSNFSTLLAAVDAAGLTTAIGGGGPFTLFAPTNAAFEKLGDDVVAGLLADIPALTSILEYHVVPDIVLKSEFHEGSLETLNSDASIDVDIKGIWYMRGPVLNGDIKIKGYDILASNGVIHVIDEVLLPPGAAPPTPSIVEIAVGNSKLSTLVTALTEANLVRTLSGDGPFTVFAPTNEAFEAVGEETLNALLADQEALTNTLLYHVVSGKVMRDDLESGDVATLADGAVVQVNVETLGFFGFLNGLFGSSGRVILNGNTEVTSFDIEGTNGVVHIIDKVLMPLQDIVGVASANNFNTLIAAATAANLVDALKGDGPLTVFAPTDAAFAKLGQETLDGLLADPDTLAKILLYHVVPGRVESSQLVQGPVSTLAEEEVDVSFKYRFFFFFEGFFLNGSSRITTTDISASNGIIHVIDEVLIPPSIAGSR